MSLSERKSSSSSLGSGARPMHLMRTSSASAPPASCDVESGGTSSEARDAATSLRGQEGKPQTGLDSQKSREDGSEGHTHYGQRAQWLRAAVLGATDGTVSTGGLLLGVSGASTDHHVLLLSGVAGLVAGSLSMAVGEYISVANQRDMEESDISKERQALSGPEFQNEYDELVQIYVNRGLEQELAEQVATALMPDLDSAVRAHARDELGIDMDDLTNPWVAGMASMLAFIVGASVPLIAAIPASDWYIRIATVVIACSAALVILGMTGNLLGGARPWKGAFRVLVGGWMAMALTFGIGRGFALLGVEDMGH